MRKDAYKQLILLSDDEAKAIQVLKAYGINTGGLTAAQIELELEDLLEENPNEFVRVCTDKNLETVSFIWDCIEHGVLRKSGNTFLFGDEVLGTHGAGRSLAGSKKNSSMLLDVKAKLKAFS